MRLYHRTTREAAEGILANGFRHSSGFYGLRRETSGVFLSDEPLGANDGVPEGGSLLIVELDLSEGDIAEFEWIDDVTHYREWQIPANLINQRAVIRIATQEE